MGMNKKTEGVKTFDIVFRGEILDIKAENKKEAMEIAHRQLDNAFSHIRKGGYYFDEKDVKE